MAKNFKGLESCIIFSLITIEINQNSEQRDNQNIPECFESEQHIYKQPISQRKIHNRIRKYFEQNDNESMTHQNLWDEVPPRQKFIALDQGKILSSSLPICCSVTKSCLILCNPMDCSTPDFPVPFSSCLQSFPASGGLFSESALHIRWPQYWGFSFSISPSNEYSGLISFRINWFAVLAVQGILKSLLQHHQFFSTQPSLWANSHIHT